MCGRFRMKSVDSHMFYTKSVFTTYALSAKYTVEGAVFWARFAVWNFFFLFSDTIENVWVPIFASVLNPEGLQVPYEEKL